jgi:N-formylglutamate amidohydrolase
MEKFTEKKYIKFYLGSKDIRSHIDAIHAAPPCSDKFTGDIVEGVVNKINCSGIIAIVSRKIIDLNRPRNSNNKEEIDEYRQTIREILGNIGNLDRNEKLSRPYLHLAIHGMRDKGNVDIEIGTLHNKTCSPEVTKWLVNEIQKHDKKVQTDGRFPGDSSKPVHRCGDQTSDLNYLGYGNNFNTFQIEISRTLREKNQKELIDIFSNIILKYNIEFK